MANLDASIVNIGLPTLARQFEIPVYSVKWVVEVYFLVITCLLLPFGRLSDTYGRKRIFFLGFITFTTGSLLCGLAPTLDGLILSRGIQASGAAMLMANGPALITAAFPISSRGTALGLLAMAVSVGLISGPALGGLLIGEFGWRAIFLSNIPFGILGCYYTHRYMPEDEPSSHRFHFDWKGSILQSVCLLVFLFVLDSPFSRILSEPWSSYLQAFMILTLVLSGYIFYQLEKKHRAPVLDFNLLRIRTFWSANLSGLLHFVAYSTIFVLMPFFLESAQKHDTRSAGIVMTMVPISIFIVSPISGRLSDLYGSVELCAIGATLTAVTLFLMSGIVGPGISATTPRSILWLCLAGIGIGLGMFQSPNNNAIMSSVPIHKLGVAAALIATIRNLGLVLGASMSTAIFSWQYRETSNFATSIRVAFFVGSLFAFAAALTAFLKTRGPIWRKKNP